MAYNLQNSPAEELRLLWRSGHGLIMMETVEERRATRLILDAAVDRRVFLWSSVQGLVQIGIGSNESKSGTHKPLSALAELAQHPKPWIAGFLDLHEHLKEPDVCRAVRETADTASRNNCCILLVSPVLPLPRELQSLAAHFLMPLPDSVALEDVVRRVYRRLKQEHASVEASVSRDDLCRLSEALLGFTEDEAERLVTQVILRDDRLDVHDVEELREAKRRAAANRGLLEIIPVTEDMHDIGGLNRLKKWLTQRRDAGSKRARELGLEPARGMLLLGVQGCGKSLCAKITAGEWRRPLLRLDMGSLYNKFIGATEANLRESLRQAEASAPCVLWIDEIEKAFASGAGEAADGGVSQRLFATMLSWMNDRTADVFIAATANDVSKLPPELMRKGRFDEIFFVDLPTREIRKIIFRIHLEKRRRTAEDFDLELLADQSKGFSGAEIEQAIVSALFVAFDDNCQLATDHIADALAQTSPISRVMAEQIRALRQWASDRCVPAHESDDDRDDDLFDGWTALPDTGRRALPGTR